MKGIGHNCDFDGFSQRSQQETKDNWGRGLEHYSISSQQ